MKNRRLWTGDQRIQVCPTQQWMMGQMPSLIHCHTLAPSGSLHGAPGAPPSHLTMQVRVAQWNVEAWYKGALTGDFGGSLASGVRPCTFMYLQACDVQLLPPEVGLLLLGGLQKLVYCSYYLCDTCGYL